MELSEREQKLLTVMSYTKWKGRSTLVLQTGKSRSWVYYTLSMLKEKDLVERRALNARLFGPGRPVVQWKRK